MLLCMPNVSWCVNPVHNVEGLEESEYLIIGILATLNWQLAESIEKL